MKVNVSRRNKGISTTALVTLVFVCSVLLFIKYKKSEKAAAAQQRLPEPTNSSWNEKEFILRTN